MLKIGLIIFVCMVLKVVCRYIPGMDTILMLAGMTLPVIIWVWYIIHCARKKTIVD